MRYRLVVRHSTWPVAVLVLVGIIADVVANVAPLPKSLDPFLWAAWPILVLLAIILIVVEVRGRRQAEPSAPSESSTTTQTISAFGPGSTAYGALFGDVIHHPSVHREEDTD